MPKATAVWLVDNTSLTFEQIAEFCGLHVLEVKGIADGDVAHGIKGMDPISSGQLTRDEIAKAEKDSPIGSSSPSPRSRCQRSRPSATRYTPVSRRQDRPNAILWLLKNHPELKDPRSCGSSARPSRPSLPSASGRIELGQPRRPGPRCAQPLLADRPRRRGEEGGCQARPRTA